jgi:putative tRNA adenosine deaminase-associated protein
MVDSVRVSLTAHGGRPMAATREVWGAKPLEPLAPLCHSGDVVEYDDGIDFALAAYREGGQWSVQDLAHDHLGDIAAISHALSRLPGDGGAVAMVAVDEDFFVIVRVAGATTRVLLSDVTAAEDWELASSAVEFLGLPELELEDEDDQVPAGDLDLLGDLGLHAMDMGVLLDDVDLYPEEILSDVARRLGFGEQFDDAVGLTSA